MEQRWPAVLWIVRHGQSAGNVARDAADAAGLGRIDIADRDMDVPLSDLGHEQARALGGWFAAMPAGQRPRTLMASPYRRAVETSQAIRASGGLERSDHRFCIDERLREKEFGVLDRLTRLGIEAQFPEQAEFRRLLGKFYHRPPGGESWCDVILRLRSLLDTISLHHGGDRVLIVAHQVVVLCLRYLLESLTEEQILEIDRQADIANCGVTEYRFDPGCGADGGLRLARYNFTAPLEGEATVTAAPDANVAAR
ncbi:histidine phosphatase family protein [Caulobacter flavus]|uniref:Histidine phosphatase family protein n=1 Tax=Caulobacter flavus TaxID=1679497 RepID=A0A2N5CX31_9CAUL|nr:histidine phosphatase family protein [Caulobacter flavus]AYV47527.1 histidine phosphatase family protein [Caulobacter flavus]PLR18369.1 histidine phosphatase family protein [Caulobacter flavus]